MSSGASINVLLTAKDAFGNSQTSGGLVVAFTQSGGTSTGNFGTLTDNANGTYSATFTGVVSGTATSISATISGNALTSTAPTATVNPGSISTSQSVLSVSASTVTSGSTINVYLQAKDLNGNNLNSGGSTIAFSNSGGTSTGTFGSTTYSGSSVYTAVFTASSSGSATNLTATIAASPVTSTPVPQITVLPGNPTSIKFSIQPTTSTTPLNPFPIQPSISTYDQNNNLITSGSNSNATIALTLNATSGTGTLGGTTSMSSVSGTANFGGKGLNISSVGTYTLTATAASLGLNAVSTTITIAATTPAITSNIPLTISYRDSTTGSGSTNSISSANYTGVAASTTTYGTYGSATTSFPAAGAAPSNTPVTSVDWTNDTSPTFSISVSGANTSSCTTNSPFTSVACYTSGFSVPWSTIYNTAISVMSGTNILQINDGYANSNSLAVSKYITSQVSNIYGSSTSDTIGAGGLSLGNYYYFPVQNNYAFGHQYFGLFRLDTSGNIVQVASPNTDGSNHGGNSINYITAFNGAIYFQTLNNVSASRMFSYTTAGTLTQINQTTICGGTWAVDSVHTRLYFAQQNSGGFCKLFYVDSSNNVWQAADIQGSTTNDGIGNLFYFNGYIWFNATCNTSTTACGAANSRIHRIDSSGNITLISGVGGTLAETMAAPVIGQPNSGNPKMYFYDTYNGSCNTVSIDSSGVKKEYVAACSSTPIAFNNSVYVVGANSTGASKLIKIDSSGNVTQAASTSGYLNVSDSPTPLNVVQQSGADTNLYFYSNSGGSLYKLYQIDTNGNVSQVTNLISGGSDGSTFGFVLPSGPSGINQYYFVGNNGTYSTNYQKIFKVYPQAN